MSSSISFCQRNLRPLLLVACGQSEPFLDIVVQPAYYLSHLMPNTKRKTCEEASSLVDNEASGFLLKAHEMISACPSHFSSWSADGLSFIVSDTAAFAREVIPRYYRHSNWASFVRQLNSYRFHRFKVTSITATCEFKHPAFQRDHPELMSGMKRISPAAEQAAEATFKADACVSDKEAEIATMKARIQQLEGQVSELYRTLTTIESDMVLLSSQVGVDLPCHHIDKMPRIESNVSLTDLLTANDIAMEEHEFDPLDMLMEEEFDWGLHATEPAPVDLSMAYPIFSAAIFACVSSAVGTSRTSIVDTSLVPSSTPI